ELGQHQHHLRAARLLQALDERVADALRGEILILDVDPASRRSDRVEVEALRLAYLRPPGVSRLGARERDRDTLEIRFDTGRPRIVERWRGLRAPPGGAAPALAPELAERRRRRTGHRHLHVVEGRVEFARRIGTARVTDAML